MQYGHHEKTALYEAGKAFTWASLRTTLQTVRELGYQPLTCEAYYQHRKAQRIPQSQRFIVFRVDVCRSPQKSLKMASILAQENIAASFFYRLHSQSYKLPSSENTRIVREVFALGFEIGLHCEPMVVSDMAHRAPEDVIQEDIKILEDMIEARVHGASSHGDARYPQINNLDFWDNHEPSEFGLSYEAYDARTFGLFQEGRYVSNSGLVRWKSYDKGELRQGDHRSLQDHIRESELPLYALIHPSAF